MPRYDEYTGMTLDDYKTISDAQLRFKAVKMAEDLMKEDATADMMFMWPHCPVKDCTNKICLALSSDKCFVHTPGLCNWKLFKIWWRHYDIKQRAKDIWIIVSGGDSHEDCV